MPRFKQSGWLTISFLTLVTPSAVQSQCPPNYVFTGEAAFDFFGTSVSGAGDVNNDGFADVIVGAHWNDAGGSAAGRAYVYSGQTGALLHTFTGEAEFDFFGFSVSGAGDVNNDGFADLIIGAYLNDAGGENAGRAYVYSGQTGALMHTFAGEAAKDQFGFSVSGAGDVNNDGFADLIVGAFVNDAGGTSAGRAYVFSGQTGALLYTFTGEAVGDFFGVSVSGAGDVNNDGFADLVVGAHGNDAGGDFAGRAYIYSGQTGSLLYTFTGEAAVDAFGIPVSGAGDVNNDGFADVIVGAHGNDAGGEVAGRAYVYSGQTGMLLHTFTGEAAFDEFGKSVSGTGDADNDGFADLIVGAFANNAGGSAAGRAYVYFLGDSDGDGLSDECDLCPTNPNPCCCNLPGDANNDDTFSIADVTFGIARIFGSGPAPACRDEADANGDNAFNVADVTYGIARIFVGGPAPVCGTTEK